MSPQNQDQAPQAQSPNVEAPKAQPPLFASTGTPTEWINPICACGDVKTTMLGCCCPCILYGKTQNRIRCVHLGNDPLDESEFKTINLPCMLFCWSPGLCTFTQHNRIRETYNIKGSWKRDLAKSLCIPCCTLLQADREVRSRAAQDEKNAGDGIWAHQPSSKNQRMRYVPQDILFWDILDSRRQSRRPTAVSSPTGVSSLEPVPKQEGFPASATLDGASMTLHTKTRDHTPQSIGSTITVLKASQMKAEKILPSDGKAEFVTKCGNHGIEVKEPGKIVSNNIMIASSSKASDNAKAGSENTAVLAEGKRGRADQSALSGGIDETVFVYYNSPSTPQPQKMRDCVKTNTSESMADYKVVLAEKLSRSANDHADSCTANEELSFEVPQIQAMFQFAEPTASPAIEPGNRERKLSTQLSKISESPDNQSRCERDESMAVNISEPSGQFSEPSDCLEGSEETLKEAPRRIPSSSATGETFENATNHLHPTTRESSILPCTPLAVEEVAEETNVEGQLKMPQEGRLGAMTLGAKFGRKVRPNFFDGNSEP